MFSKKNRCYDMSGNMGSNMMWQNDMANTKNNKTRNDGIWSNDGL